MTRIEADLSAAQEHFAAQREDETFYCHADYLPHGARAAMAEELARFIAYGFAEAPHAVAA